ncbi:GldL-related protein [Flavobacterium okayamense]|uniref:Gliding motility protein GldL-like N-terminal domain-containing protein n=1 Tax=Flavobacterium okayamense TaxID=2830782 RepID=A0ABM7S8Z7_9FLAO|nr:hypothetical protein [Flavobacterium okayamense]BCY29185.1 hypothetical protein KK2020170_20530 [Flavobacterium okayamense]
MNSKYKLPLVLFLVGMIFSILGALFKMMHWMGAHYLLIFGMLTEAFALIVLIFAILRKDKLK